MLTTCAASLLTGCSDDTTPQSTTRTTSTALRAEDELACSSAQTTLQHLARATATWSPRLRPFDEKFQPKVLRYANDLEVAADTASSDAVQQAMRGSALAFFDLSTSMARRDSDLFADALQRTKTGYASLKQVCAF